jgi:3-oxoacyl-[acyl-carrier-protein] synthase-1/3-oxoacyl-[acyl-carrier-protein] synthase II
MMRKTAPVSITGMGCLTAAGTSLAANIAALDAGTRGPLPPSLFTAEKNHPVFMCDLSGADAAAFAALPGARLPAGYSRTVRLAAFAALEALCSAGLDPQGLAGLKAGVCLGTSVGTALEFYNIYCALRAGKEGELGEIDAYLGSNPALALARILRFAGPAHCVTNACSSGADAIGIAAQWIRDGLCDIALCGGADALARITYLGFASLRLTSPEACLPFDKNRAGLNLGEGAAFLVLESPERIRGRKSAGAVLGYGTATDAHHLTAPHPEARGLVMALEQALAQAGARREDLAFINAHGTATRTNDAAEGAFFAAHFPGTPFVATKGGTGHTLGAAGAVEAVFTLAHLARGMLPASPGFTEPDPDIGASPVAVPTAVSGSMAMSQSLAFGGNNSVLILGKGDAP